MGFLIMKFVCGETDDNDEIIPDSGCGEVDRIYLHLYNFIDTPGEGFKVTIDNAGDVFFTEAQVHWFPSYWNEDKLIQIVKRKTDQAYSLDFGQCPNCGECALVQYSEEED
jgi:hypothetical protein